jgi:isopentenyl diphosphate isomerase/L-lactate dehydrogenase-like FMN-dependent dehydrogenase
MLIKPNRLFVLPRVLRDVAEVDTSAELLGHTYPLPIGIAPSAMQRLAGGEGEMDVARAAAAMGLSLTLSSNSTTSLEDVMSINRDMGSTTPFWFQLYLATKLDLSIPLIKRAEGLFQPTPFTSVLIWDLELITAQLRGTKRSFSRLTRRFLVIESMSDRFHLFFQKVSSWPI